MIEHTDLPHLTNEELLNEQAYTDLHIDELQAQIKKLARYTYDRNRLRMAIEDHCIALDRLMAVRHEWERRQSVLQCQSY
jgi:hypothetical protein